MKQTTFLLVALALVAGGGFIYFTRTGAPSEAGLPAEAAGMGVTGVAAETADPYDVEIVFDGEQFVPSELAIQKGTRVRFLNKSTTPVWPAAAVHPTHSLYPEKNSSNCLGSSFDACKTLAQGEFFNFTFNHAGEWRYHDHAHAYYTGVITVSEN